MEGRIPIGILHVEWRIRRQVDSPSGDQRYTGAVKRDREPGEGDLPDRRRPRSGRAFRQPGDASVGPGQQTVEETAQAKD